MQLGWHPVAAVQYTVTHKQYTEQHNETEYPEGNIHSNKTTWFTKLNISNIYVYMYIIFLDVIDSVFLYYFRTVCPRCKSYLRDVFKHPQSLYFAYSQAPIQHGPLLAPMKIFVQKFSVIQYFDLPPRSINGHKLRWTKSGAISWLDYALLLCLCLNVCYVPSLQMLFFFVQSHKGYQTVTSQHFILWFR